MFRCVPWDSISRSFLGHPAPNLEFLTLIKTHIDKMPASIPVYNTVYVPIPVYMHLSCFMCIPYTKNILSLCTCMCPFS